MTKNIPSVSGQTFLRLPLLPWNVLVPGFAPLLLSKKSLSRTIMRAMNSAVCQELILAVSAKLAAVYPGNRNKACKGRGHLCPLHWAALTSAVLAPATATHSPMNLFSSSFSSKGIVSNLALRRVAEDVSMP